uniref:Uncharacterized protein n=1 Tax=Parascaris equorum TaxID=6256 RepID=A0A914RI65_PAREQ
MRLQECCVRLSGVLRDASHLLSGPHRDISLIFADALDLSILIYVENERLRHTSQQSCFKYQLRSFGLLSHQKCVLLELHEHYETFVERKEQCIRSLNGVRATMKLAMIGGSSSSDLDMSSEVLCLHRCLLASIPDSVHSSESLMATRLEPNSDFLLFALQKK